MCVRRYVHGWFALVAALGTSAEARKLKEYLKKAHEAATSFEQANCFLQCSLKEDTMNLPGFGAEDGPLVGEIVLHNFGSEKVGKNFHRVHSKYLLQNPGVPQQNPIRGGAACMLCHKKIAAAFLRPWCT